MNLELSMPSAIDTERAILGSLMLDNKLFFDCANLQQFMFSLDSNQRIYRHIAELIKADQVADILTVPDSLRSKRELEAVGGLAYLFSLTEGLPKRSSIEDYVAIAKEKYQLRRLMGTCAEIADRASEQNEESAQLMAFLQGQIESILDQDSGDDPKVSAYSQAAFEAYETERSLKCSPGLSYGIEALDTFSGGMRRGEVTIVGARSGVGKTALMCQTVAANCMDGIACHLFSLEMTREQILRRLWAIVSGVPYKRITDPWLSNLHEEQSVKEAAAAVSKWPLRIHDKAELNLDQIASLARVSIRRHGTRFIGVDYAQEIEAPGRDERTRVIAVARKLSRLVKHENCSLMLLSQLIKTQRENYNKAPVVGDLIESGKLENVAHIILLLHRGWNETEGKISDEAEILIPKQRRGPTGSLQGAFNRRSVTFNAWLEQEKA